MQHLSWDEVWDFLEETGTDVESSQHMQQCQVCAKKLDRVRIAQAAIRQTLNTSVATSAQEPVGRPLRLPDVSQLSSSFHASSTRRGKRGLGWSLAGGGMAVAAVIGLVVGLHSGQIGWMQGIRATSVASKGAVPTSQTALASSKAGTSSTSSGTGTSGTSFAPSASSAPPPVQGPNSDVANGPAQFAQSPAKSAATHASLNHLPPDKNPIHGLQPKFENVGIDVNDESGTTLGQVKVAVFRGDRLLELGSTDAQGAGFVFSIDPAKVGQVLHLPGLDASGLPNTSLTIVLWKTGYQPGAVFGVGFTSSPGPRAVSVTLLRLGSGTAEQLSVQVVHYGGGTDLAAAAEDARMLVEWLGGNRTD